MKKKDPNQPQFPNTMRTLRRKKDMDGKWVWASETTEQHEPFRNHRFIVRPKNATPNPNDPDWDEDTGKYLQLRSVRFINKNLILKFYLTDWNLDFIIKAKYPKKMLIALLSGFGDEKAWVEVSGLKFIETRADSLVFDYASSEIMTIDVLFKFEKAKLVRAHPKHYTGKEKHA